MNSAETPWKKSTFVSASNVVHKPRHKHRSQKRSTAIVRSKKVKMNPTPVILGESPEKIKITPVMQNGQVIALHVSCSCGCESTFDVQYAASAPPITSETEQGDAA